ncbi:MAG: 16S rRNA (guanine(966)-N(2))-methyltransferase RsmD [Deltaproteobacteria bacterium]|nr:16S rRNA (guanine(966)-N(2))-methyltransferase RsmD [Deltaproteobacteria bacterium]
MKVIGGRAKGKRIYVPKGAVIRATTDRTKESLFNILPSVEGSSFLDLFAGTGNVGIEALSRGASQCVFVEKDPHLIKAIKKNLQHCGFADQFDIIPFPVEKGIRGLAKRKECCDIIFADPPYIQGLVQKTINLLMKYSILSIQGIVVIEHSPKETFHDADKKIVLSDQRRYGDSMLSFFEIK